MFAIPAPLPGAPPPRAAPLPTPPLWKHFIQKMGREPNDPSELQQYAFFNLIDGKKQFITQLDAYLILKENASDDRKRKLLESLDPSATLLIIADAAVNVHRSHWIPKQLICDKNMDDTLCLFPFPELKYLFHQQIPEYFTSNIRNVESNNEFKATCAASHPLHYTSPDELYAKHPNYFTGQYIGYKCDVCSAICPATYAWHCALCQYDLCDACYKTRSMAPGKAPMAPRAPQHDKYAPHTPRDIFWTPSIVSAAALLNAPYTKTTAVLFNEPHTKSTVSMSPQYVINKYENEFIYDNLAQYARYNQDIYDKLHVFNGKKRYYVNNARLMFNARVHSTSYMTKNIDHIANETTRQKLNIIAIDVQNHCPFTVCYKIVRNLEDNDDEAVALHYKLKNALNSYEEKYDETDIYIRPMMDKLYHKGENVTDRKWKVMGIVDPDKHLATLQHSSDLSTLQHAEDKINTMFDCISWYHWIPSVFRVNKTLTKCELMSEIPNLNPYECRDTIYPLISQLFLSFVKQFEHITTMNLRGYDLQCVVKVQDYVINDIKEDDEYGSYYGNFHKEGLYEDIAAVGLYYYHISKDIKGGELALTVIKQTSSRYHHINTDIESCPVSVAEGTQLVFNNYKCFHRVQKLYGNGNRKMIAFHLINPGNRLISAKHIIVNWKYHSIHFVRYYCRILLNNDNIQFICDITLLFVIGDKRYIESTTEIHNQCRRHFFKEHASGTQLGFGAPPLAPLPAPPPLPFAPAPLPRFAPLPIPPLFGMGAPPPMHD